MGESKANWQEAEEIAQAIIGVCGSGAFAAPEMEPMHRRRAVELMNDLGDALGLLRRDVPGVLEPPEHHDDVVMRAAIKDMPSAVRDAPMVHPLVKADLDRLNENALGTPRAPVPSYTRPPEQELGLAVMLEARYQMHKSFVDAAYLEVYGPDQVGLGPRRQTAWQTAAGMVSENPDLRARAEIVLRWG